MTKPKEQKTAKPRADRERYWGAVGRRKTAIARVRISKGTGTFLVNEKSPAAYFHVLRHRTAAFAPLTVLNLGEAFNASIKVRGGGIAAQAGAVRHGLARAVSLAEPEFKKRLRESGFLTRDSRMVERKKYGLRKARRAPQWAKR